MLTRPHYDYSKVAPEHKEVHAILENWGAWSRSCTRALSSCHPMFRYCKSPEHWERTTAPSQHRDVISAIEVQRRMHDIEPTLRKVLAWAYIRCDSPARFAKSLDTNGAGLWHLLQAARTKAAEILVR